VKQNTSLEILKQAILLERRGKAFYRKVAEKTEINGVRDVFETMAAEEPGNYKDSDSSRVASKVLTREIKEKISAAGFEAAAISAAISMEEHAVKLYSESAETTSDPEAKALYEWLARWEREHLGLLLDIDKGLREKIWFDNQFWPF